MTRYRLELIGGPYDGAADLWLGSKQAELPPSLLIGRCPGDGACCAKYGGKGCSGDRHVAWWQPMEAGSDRVETSQYARLEVEANIARYIHAEVDLPALLETRETVGASALMDAQFEAIAAAAARWSGYVDECQRRMGG